MTYVSGEGKPSPHVILGKQPGSDAYARTSARVAKMDKAMVSDSRFQVKG